MVPIIRKFIYIYLQPKVSKYDDDDVAVLT